MAQQARKAVLLDLQVKPPRALQWAHTPKGITAFSALISQHHCYNSAQEMALELSDHALYHKTCRDLAIKTKTSPLWFSVMASKAVGGNKKVVRSHMQRRVKYAFMTTLNSHGYDIKGNRLDDAVGNEAKSDSLYGSIAVHAKEAALTLPLGEMESHADLVVKQLMKQTGRGRPKPSTFWDVLAATTRREVQKQGSLSNTYLGGKKIAAQNRKNITSKAGGGLRRYDPKIE